jgi:hypothetical protein
VTDPAGPSVADLQALQRHATALADGIEEALGPWVARCVRTRIEDSGGVFTAEVRDRAAAAGRAAVEDTVPRIRALLELDIDAQPTGPLSVVRSAVVFPTDVLRAAGVPPVERDDAARTMFPDDDYDLTPASFAELDPALTEAGIVWGAAKAHVHLVRRRSMDEAGVHSSETSGEHR